MIVFGRTIVFTIDELGRGPVREIAPLSISFSAPPSEGKSTASVIVEDLGPPGGDLDRNRERSFR